MNSFSSAIQNIKSYLAYATLYKMSVISIILFAIGGVCAAVVVYVYALQPPAVPADSKVTIQSSVSIAKPALAEVQKYASVKEESAKKVPTINGLVFYIPSVK